jgi:hypothetical protein
MKEKENKEKEKSQKKKVNGRMVKSPDVSGLFSGGILIKFIESVTGGH